MHKSILILFFSQYCLIKHYISVSTGEKKSNFILTLSRENSINFPRSNPKSTQPFLQIFLILPNRLHHLCTTSLLYVGIREFPHSLLPKMTSIFFFSQKILLAFLRIFYWIFLSLQISLSVFNVFYYFAYADIWVPNLDHPCQLATGCHKQFVIGVATDWRGFRRDFVVDWLVLGKNGLQCTICVPLPAITTAFAPCFVMKHLPQFYHILYARIGKLALRWWQAVIKMLPIQISL